jgi:flagellin
MLPLKGTQGEKPCGFPKKRLERSMSTVINTNMASLFAQNSLANAQNNLATSVQRLSSGLRINTAKDDAAGLAIAQSMQGQINGTNQSIRNLSDATNLLQTADSSLATIQDMLLRLKQLAVQGYDGSLSSQQKLSILNEMKDLNTEINATATRTTFNGINLLSSGASVDSVNSDLAAGDDLITTAVSITAAVSTVAGIGSAGTLSNSVTTYATSISDAFKNKLAGQSFTFSNAGSNLTMTGTIDGQTTSQTISINDVIGNGTVGTYTQTLGFDSFGTTITLSTLTAATYGTYSGSTMASGFTTRSTLGITGSVGTISDIKLTGVQSGTYTLTNTAGTLTMSGTLDGVLTNQSLELTTVSKNTTSTFDFSAFGVKFDVKAYAVDYSNTSIGAAIVALNGGTQSTAGSLVISSSGSSDLQFQSGSNSDSFIGIQTLNVMTDNSGVYTGSVSDMTDVGAFITGTSSGQLGDLNASDTTSTWQTAFQNAESAIDAALNYISTQRGIFGSQMNRLGYISTNLTAQSTNLQNSRSSIIDTDFASETAKLTKGQIMQQAATAMLAQANQMPNVVLSLLK